MPKKRTAAQDIASPEEVLRTFTQIMRGEMTELSGRKNAEGEELSLPPKVSERSKAAELLGKRYGLFSDRQPDARPKAELAQEIEAAMQALHEP